MAFGKTSVISPLNLIASSFATEAPFAVNPFAPVGSKPRNCVNIGARGKCAATVNNISFGSPQSIGAVLTWFPMGTLTAKLLPSRAMFEKQGSDR